MKALPVLLFAATIGCSGPDAEAPPAVSEDPTVFDPLTATLERAASVEDTLRESEANRRRQLEETEGQ